MRHVTIVLLASIFTACGSKPPPPASPGIQQVAYTALPTADDASWLAPGGSSGSGSSSGSESEAHRGKPISVPHRVDAPTAAEIKARPDVLAAELAVREVKADSHTSIAAA